jgi:hypothetical protein
MVAGHIAAGGCALIATHDLDFVDALGARRFTLESAPPAG